MKRLTVDTIQERLPGLPDWVARIIVRGQIKWVSGKRTEVDMSGFLSMTDQELRSLRGFGKRALSIFRSYQPYPAADRWTEHAAMVSGSDR